MHGTGRSYWSYMIMIVMIVMIIITGEDQQAAHSQDHRHLLGRRLGWRLGRGLGWKLRSPCWEVLSRDSSVIYTKYQMIYQYIRVPFLELSVFEEWFPSSYIMFDIDITASFFEIIKFIITFDQNMNSSFLKRLVSAQTFAVTLKPVR